MNKEFCIKDIFHVDSPKKKFNANSITFGGQYAYVARGSANNGIRGYISEDTEYLNPAKSFTFGQDTATIYYQKEPYFTGDKIKILTIKQYPLDDEIAMYLVTVIRKAFSGYSWGTASFNENIIKNTKISLPVIESFDTFHQYTPNDIDWIYMRNYIKRIELDYMKQIAIFLKLKYKAKTMSEDDFVTNEGVMNND